jgi:hypothetical protein
MYVSMMVAHKGAETCSFGKKAVNIVIFDNNTGYYCLADCLAAMCKKVSYWVRESLVCFLYTAW